MVSVVLDFVESEGRTGEVLLWDVGGSGHTWPTPYPTTPPT
jgi:hypothetical protein